MHGRQSKDLSTTRKLAEARRSLWIIGPGLAFSQTTANVFASVPSLMVHRKLGYLYTPLSGFDDGCCSHAGAALLAAICEVSFAWKPSRKTVTAAVGDEAEAPTEGAPVTAPKPAQKRMKITYPEYQRIGQMLAKHLAVQEEAGEEVKEEELIAWYMEQVEETIETEAQLFENQHLVQLIINRLIDKDRVIVVYRPAEDPLRPEGRVLVKHPNFPVGQSIGEVRRGA